MNQESHAQQSRFSPHRIENLFFINGIISLLGWNLVLTSLDYFHYVYSEYNVYLYFPVPCFIAYVVTGITFNQISLKFKYKHLVTVGILGTNLSICLLLAVSLLTRNSPAIGYWISLFLAFSIGFFSNICQLSFFAMINYFGQPTVSRFTIGTAGGGLMLITLRIIIVSIFGSHESDLFPIILYICITLVFSFFDLILNLKLFKSQKYLDTIKDGGQQDEFNQALIDKKQCSKQTKSFLSQLKDTFVSIFPWPAFIFINYVLTFVLFPNLTLLKTTDLEPIWTILILLLMYNVGDFVGKIIGDFRKSFNSFSVKFLIISRFFFLYSIIGMDSSFASQDSLLNNDYFPFFNQLLFGITNGLLTNACFILSFENAINQHKKYAGVLGGILLQMGIMTGTLLAIPLEKAVDPI